MHYFSRECYEWWRFDSAGKNIRLDTNYQKHLLCAHVRHFKEKPKEKQAKSKRTHCCNRFLLSCFRFWSRTMLHSFRCNSQLLLRSEETIRYWTSRFWDRFRIIRISASDPVFISRIRLARFVPGFGRPRFEHLCMWRPHAAGKSEGNRRCGRFQINGLECV